MTLRNRILLTWRYGKAQFLVGAVYATVCAALLAGGFSYMFFVDAFILKAPIMAITLYLAEQFRDRDAIFFYINLGLSRRRLLVSIILIDFLAFALLMTVMLLIHG